jgi:EAL domain-containing protein (putative c-di-GMP-specific phosphodiesterase class I)/GGDEF domain-containing protein
MTAYSTVAPCWKEVPREPARGEVMATRVGRTGGAHPPTRPAGAVRTEAGQTGPGRPGRVARLLAPFDLPARMRYDPPMSRQGDKPKGPADSLIRVLQRVLGAPRAQGVKDVLFDPVTALPTLPVLLPYIRKILEDGKGVGLVAVDITNFSKLEEVYGWETFDGIIRGVAACLKAIKDASLRKGDALAELVVNGSVFILILSPPRSGRSLRNRDLSLIKKRLAKGLDTYLGNALNPDLLRRFRYFLGGSVMTRDPAVRVERLVYRTIDEALSEAASEKERVLRSRGRQLRTIIDRRRISTVYQPIIDLRTRTVLGYEALSRGPRGEFETPEALFQVAYQAELVLKLERVCREKALRRLSLLKPEQLMFINIEPACIFDAKLVEEDFIRRFASRVVFEITERAAITDFSTFRQAVQFLKHSGFKVALDDVGSAYSGLRVISEIAPDLIKLDMQLTRGADDDQVKRQLIGAVARFCTDVGVPLIAEGIETQGELQAVQALGVHLGQGFVFGSPAEVPGKEQLTLPEPGIPSTGAPDALRPE